MGIEEYNQARSRGQRESRTRLAAGLSPTLEVLDEHIEFIDIVTQEPLGLVNVPLERIVGTKTSGRQSAFSAGFMPLLPVGTEFSDKWSNLCDIHLREGICVPIKAYEYQNKFYVEEGNKRVSVLKFYDALTIPATVTRLIPAREDTLQSRLYYEFLAFYKYTGINYIDFTREGSFAALSTAVCKAAGEYWTTDDKRNFYSFYHMFRPQFESLDGPALGLTAADAALVYLSVYRYSDSIAATGKEIYKNLEKIWEEITVLTEQNAVSLSLEPKVLPTDPSLFSKLLPSFSGKSDALKVVFLHERDACTSGWTKNHGEGRRALESYFPGQVLTSHVDHIQPGVDDAVNIEAAVRGGADVIFTTSPPMLPACLKIAARHPKVKILNCSLNVPHPLVRTYYSRIHEVKYLLGLLAGILSPSDEIGYIAHYPIYGTPASINAFALGVQAVRPHAKIVLRWTCVAAHNAILNFADRENLFVFSGRDQLELQDSIPLEHQDFGLCKRLPNGKIETLATPQWRWDVVYKEIIRGVLDGTWENEEADTLRAINYWWGLKSGSVGISYADNLPAGSLALVRIVQEQLKNGLLNPFSGSFFAQGHIQKQPYDAASFSPEELIHMDYLLENIEGEIPHISTLIPKACRLVEFQGVACAKEN